MKKLILISIFAFFAGFQVMAQKYVLPNGLTAKDYIPGAVILKLKPEYPEILKSKSENAELNRLFSDLKVKSITQKFPNSLRPSFGEKKYGIVLPDITLIYEITISDETEIADAINKLLASGFFEYAQPHFFDELMYTPNDPNIGSQYYLGRISAYAAWDICKSDTNKVIAITDTGFEFNHPDLVNSVKYNFLDPIDGIDNDNDGYVDNYQGWDMGQMDNNPQFGVYGHGIHVSGIAGATADNTFGIAGVGFKSKLLPVKIDNANGQIIAGYEGIVYSADHGAQVINCSWGSAYYSGDYIKDIINYASLVRGCLVVAACGNSFSEVPFYPASATYVLSVAGSNSLDKKWTNSSFGYFVDVSAPGEAIYSTWGGASFVTSAGTSMASPVVAGAAALVSSHYPELNMLQVAEVLRNSADSIDTVNGNEIYAGKLGTGRINLYRALTDTLRPSVRLIDHRFLNNLFGAGDTLKLVTFYTNYLSRTQNTKVRIECKSPFVQMLDSVYYQGNMGTLETDSNSVSPFRILLKGNLPTNYNLQILVYFESDNSVSRDPVNYVVNTDYFQLDTNNISVTVVGNSNLGFNDGYLMMQGRGLTYKNRANLLTMAGFMAGTSAVSISDNVYGFSIPGDTDFRMSYPTTPILNPMLGDKAFLSQFSDTSLATNSNKIKILQYAYAWNTPEDADYMILKYRVININTVPLISVYTGFFADWDVGSASSNRAHYDADGNLIVAYDLDSSMFIGLCHLYPADGTHYLFDMNGFNGSITVNDGFSGLEKYSALTSVRNSAGVSTAGNDIAMLLASGPFTIESSDTTDFVIAILAGENITAIRNAAERARLRYRDPLLNTQHYEIDNFKIFPNPSDGSFQIDGISNTEYPANVVISDAGGRVCMSFTLQSSVQYVSTTNLNPGVYFVRIGSKVKILFIGR